MLKSFAALLLTLLAVIPAHAGLMKELYFEGVMIDGADFTGNVFTPAPALLAGKTVTGRFVFDVGLLTPAVAFGATHADYDDPLHPAGGCYGPCTTPFMSAFITIDGHTHEFENAAQPSIPAPVRHSIVFDDRPDLAAADFASLYLRSFRPQICPCNVHEGVEMILTGIPGGFLSGESFGQDFDVALAPSNIFSSVVFQAVSGLQYGSVYIPSTPAFGAEALHYANGTVSLSRVSLRSIITVAAPEPGSWALMIAGALCLLATRRLRAS